MFLPAGTDRIDPFPLGLYLVAPDEQRLVAFDEIEQQAFVGDAALRTGKGIRHGNLKRDRAQADAVAVEAGNLGHQ